VEQVQGHQGRLGVAREDVHIVALGRGHLLPLLDLFHRGQQVAQRRGLLEAHLFGGRFHARAKAARRSPCRPSSNSFTSRTAPA